MHSESSAILLGLAQFCFEPVDRALETSFCIAGWRAAHFVLCSKSCHDFEHGHVELMTPRRFHEIAEGVIDDALLLLAEFRSELCYRSVSLGNPHLLVLFQMLLDGLLGFGECRKIRWLEIWRVLGKMYHACT